MAYGKAWKLCNYAVPLYHMGCERKHPRGWMCGRATCISAIGEGRSECRRQHVRVGPQR
jgi:hypothetical protein